MVLGITFLVLVGVLNYKLLKRLEQSKLEQQQRKLDKNENSN